MLLKTRLWFVWSRLHTSTFGARRTFVHIYLQKVWVVKLLGFLARLNTNQLFWSGLETTTRVQYTATCGNSKMCISTMFTIPDQGESGARGP